MLDFWLWHKQHRSQYGGKILIQLIIQQENKHYVLQALISRQFEAMI